ncbi:hypothetical protein G3T14_20545 [Methylobacterium sp. BTF04]|uniref:hypothetical protein n=1 Tax=Methylobacterium sp. BTF04 TaxID=2708300 RepID=UPI0013D0B5D1|nr:hypothetical protein [Methylobacterium sp. BTF04]NEU14492.1 hypothetical protein [Methylobacterium sp. BTF04]
MMDLSAFAMEVVADLAMPKTVDLSTLPNYQQAGGNGQPIVKNDVSQISHPSHQPNSGSSAKLDFRAQAGASAGEWARATTLLLDGGKGGNCEKIDKNPTISTADTSHFLSFDWENEKEVGNLLCSDGLLDEPAPPDSNDLDERAAFLKYECGLTRDQAEAQVRSEFGIDAFGAQTDLPDVGALPELDGVALWLAGLAQIGPNEPPCPGYRAQEWPVVYARSVAFLEEFGAQAEALGWTAPRLFGAHPEAGIVRVDYCGALILPVGGQVRSITSTEICLGHLTHRTKSRQPEGVPIWKLQR